MRILIVQDTDWIRRNPIQHNHLAERLVLRGHEIRVIDYEILWRMEGKKEQFSKRSVFHVSRILKDANHTVIRPGILKIPLLDYVSMLFTYKREINRQIGEFKPDIIIGDGIITPYLAFQSARKNNIKTLYYCIDVNYKLIPFRFIHIIGKILESQNMKKADLVVSINEGLREYTIRMGAIPDKTHVVRAGVDLNNLDPLKDGKEVRGKYGFKNEDRILFFVGWLYHFSGLKEVAIELSKVKDETIKLLIVGDGDAFEELQRVIKEYRLDGRMIMTGKQPYGLLPKLLAAADICLLPGYDNEIMRDIVPIKMYEYMAMKKPVISTKLHGVIKEFGEDNGVVYVDGPEDVVTKSIELIQNGTVKELGSKARSFVERNSWDSITDEFEKILEETIKV